MGLVRLRQEGLEWRVVEDEVVALDINTSMYFAVNGTGAFLWQMLASATAADDLTAALIAEFEVDPETAALHVHEFVQSLMRSDLIEEVL